MIRVSANLYRASDCLRAVDHFLHDIEITNFKSIRSQKIEGCKRINVFIGYPNVGKSNILEALSTLVYLEGRHKENVHISDLVRLNDEFHLLFFDGNKEEPAIIQYLDEKRVVIIYHSRDELQFVAQVLDDIAVNNVVGWGSKGGISFLKEKRFGDSLEGNNWDSIGVRKYSFSAGKKFNIEGGKALYAPNGENLFFILETNAHLRKEVAKLFSPNSLKLLFNKKDNYDFSAMKFLDEETFFSIPFSQIADTLQRLIFYKAAITSNNDSVLLFEEPEAHMFPPYIKLFTNDIVDKKSNQFFIATHSPFVLNELMEHGRDELSVYTVDLKNGETTIKRITDEELEEVHQYGVDLFFNLESYL